MLLLLVLLASLCASGNAVINVDGVDVDFSNVCQTPVSYTPNASYDASVTCDEFMERSTTTNIYKQAYTRLGVLQGKNWSDPSWCDSEPKTDDSLQNLHTETKNVREWINEIAVQCCGSGSAESRRSACYVDHSYFCKTPSSYSPSNRLYGGHHVGSNKKTTARTCASVMNNLAAGVRSDQSGNLLFPGVDFSRPFTCVHSYSMADLDLIEDIANKCCDKPFFGSGKDLEDYFGGKRGSWESKRSACSYDYSHLCKNSSHYKPETNVLWAKKSCQQMMNYYTTNGRELQGKDFSSAFSCESETKETKQIINTLGSTCCSSIALGSDPETACSTASRSHISSPAVLIAAVASLFLFGIDKI